MMKNSFECKQCGACCKWEGHVHLLEKDICRIAECLEISIDEFINGYCEIASNRQGLCLKDNENGVCIFLDEKMKCRVYDSRPEQCRQFPKMWNVEENECPGQKTV